MQTIVIKLDSRKLKNTDLDIRYNLPDCIEKYTNGRITDNGYDYITNYELGIWLETENSEESVLSVVEVIKNDGNLSQSAEIYISSEENADLKKCIKVYP